MFFCVIFIRKPSKDPCRMKTNVFYEAARLFLKAYARFFFKLDIQWREQLPEGPKLFIANHPSATDPFLIHLLSRMSVLITGNAFTFPLFGMYIKQMGQISVMPGQGQEALNRAIELLRQGHSVGIFPEGRFSPQEGGMAPARSGAARLALLTGVPVIPVGIYLPRERCLQITARVRGKQMVGYWYLRGPYAMTVGTPMQFSGDPENREHVAYVTETMMEWLTTLARESENRLRGSLALQQEAA